MTEFNSTANDLVCHLGFHADKNDTIEIANYLQKATLDVIGKVDTFYLLTECGSHTMILQ